MAGSSEPAVYHIEDWAAKMGFTLAFAESLEGDERPLMVEIGGSTWVAESPKSYVARCARAQGVLPPSPRDLALDALRRVQRERPKEPRA